MQPKRILITLEALDLSGPAFSAQNLVAGLWGRGVRPQVLARAGGEREASFRSSGVKVVLSDYFGLPLLGYSALRESRQYEPELIHAQSVGVAARSFQLAKKLNKPLVVTVNRLEDEAHEFLARHKDIRIIAVSDAILERLTNRDGIGRERIKVIPNGLNLNHFPCRPLEMGSDKPHLPVVGSYGTLAERKGQRVFLRAAAEVIKYGMDAEFLIMGHGPDKPALRQLAAELGIANRVTFTPSTHSDAGNFTSIDLLVEPTYQEGLGLSVLQAMASGVPVVASGVGGIYSLIKDGETGALVPSGDAGALATTIRELLSDPARRLELARQARDRVEKEFNIERISRQVIEYYSEVLGDTVHA